MSTGDAVPFWAWGVDPAFGFPALSAVREDETPQLVRFESGTGTLPERLETLLADVELKAGQLCNDCPPGLVLVERPTGRHPSPHLGYATGVIILGLHRALRDRFPFPVSVVQISIGEWKKATIGKGNASKDEVMNWVLDEWPALDGCSQDEADATAIGVMAYESIVSSEREEAA